MGSQKGKEQPICRTLTDSDSLGKPLQVLSGGQSDIRFKWEKHLYFVSLSTNELFGRNALKFRSNLSSFILFYCCGSQHPIAKISCV